MMLTEGTISTPDIVILIVVLVSALIGLVRGILKEVLSLASWVAAFILALYFAPMVADYLTDQLADPAIRLVVGFAGVFVATLIAGGVVQWLLRKLVDSTGLSGTDRFLGFLFGSARGVLVCIIGLIVLRPYAEHSDWWRASEFAPELLAFEQDVLELLGNAKQAASNISNEL